MKDVVGLFVEGLAGLATLLAALGVSSWVGRASSRSGSDERGPRLRVLAGLVLTPLVVLALSPVAAGLCGWHDLMRAWLLLHAEHRRAWEVFWFVMLVLGAIEFLWRGWYAWRKRAFPVPPLMRSIMHAAVVTGVALAVVKGILGHDISTALASTALLTAVVGFALQGVLGNLLAGMSLHMSGSTAPGDWVAVGDVEGEVVETNWRETRLRTLGGHMLHIPNSKVADSVIHNMSRPTPRRRHHVEVGASYSDAPGEVIDALLQSALSVPSVLRDPPPTAYVERYQDFGINYVLRYWTDSYHQHTPIDGDVQRMIWYQFKRRGIEIPFPMSDKLLNDFMEVVYHQRVQPPPDSELERRARDLASSDFCRKLLADQDGAPLLSAAELRAVAGDIRHTRFSAGETIFRQGEEGDTAYVVVRGLVKGRVAHPDVPTVLFELGPGALFGEMNLITGLPRTATLTMESEVELLAIPRDAFTRILALRPEIPQELSALVAQRAAQNAAAYERLKAAGSGQAADALRQHSIFERFMQLLGRK